MVERAVGNPLAVDEHHNVLAQPPLVVQRIAAQRRIFGEYRVQRRADRAPCHRARRAGEVAFELGRELDLGHKATP